MSGANSMEDLRREQVGLKNEGLEAKARPGRQTVVIPVEQLRYYERLEGLLAEALDLTKPPAAVQLDLETVKQAIREEFAEQADSAIARAMAKLTGIDGTPPPAPPLEAGEGSKGGSPEDKGDPGQPPWGNRRQGNQGKDESEAAGNDSGIATSGQAARQKKARPGHPRKDVASGKRRRVGEPSVLQGKKKGRPKKQEEPTWAPKAAEWLTAADLLKRKYSGYETPDEEALWRAVYAGKIAKQGRGQKALLKVADYEAWLETYRPRGS